MNTLDLDLELLEGEGLDLGEFELTRLNRDPLGGGEPRAGEYTGIKALMLAMLEESVQSYLSPIERVRTAAEHWIMSRRQASPFSFHVVCDTLGLEPNAVRIAVRRLRTNSTKRRPLARSRPNVRRTPRLIAGDGRGQRRVSTGTSACLRRDAPWDGRPRCRKVRRRRRA